MFMYFTHHEFERGLFASQKTTNYLNDSWSSPWNSKVFGADLSYKISLGGRISILSRDL